MNRWCSHLSWRRDLISHQTGSGRIHSVYLIYHQSLVLTHYFLTNLIAKRLLILKREFKTPFCWMPLISRWMRQFKWFNLLPHLLMLKQLKYWTELSEETSTLSRCRMPSKLLSLSWSLNKPDQRSLLSWSSTSRIMLRHSIWMSYATSHSFWDSSVTPMRAFMILLSLLSSAKSTHYLREISLLLFRASTTRNLPRGSRFSTSSSQ